jgi:hypothetical protein
MKDALAEAHLSLLGQPIAASVAQLAEPPSSLGAVRSESPRAFAPTVRSDPSALAPSSASLNKVTATTPGPLVVTPRSQRAPGNGLGAFVDGETVPSTELRVSQLGSGHPTTSGGAFSVERTASSHSSAAGPRGSSRRWVGLGVAVAACAALAGASFYGYRTDAPVSRDLGGAVPPPVEPVVVAAPPPQTQPIPGANAAPAETSQPRAEQATAQPAPSASSASSKRATSVAAASGVAHAPTSVKPAQPAKAQDAPGSAATAAQGGVVVTAPF